MADLPTPANQPHERFYPSHTTDKGRQLIERTTQQLQFVQQKQTRLHRHITKMYFNDHPKTHIIETLNTSYPTIKAALTSNLGLRALSLLAHLSELKGGPTSDDRKAMAWRIAQQTELTKPDTSLKAIDLLNKQAGEYQQEDNNQTAGITINVQNFTVQAPPDNVHTIDAPRPTEKDITPTFQPTTINTETD